MLSLYELTEAYYDLINMDLEPEDLVTALNSIEGDIKQKANNIGKVINSLASEQLVYENEIKRLQGKLKASKTKETNVKQYLSDSMKNLNLDKIQSELFKFSFRKSESVVIEQQSEIPEEFVNFKEVATVDKKELKKWLKDGHTCIGAKVEVKQNLQIK